MRPLTRAAALLAVAVATTASPAGAVGSGCASGAPMPGWTSGPPGPFLAVTGALGAANGAPCPGGATASTAAAPCVWTWPTPAPAEFVVSGAYCGPGYVPKATINCGWDPVGPVAADTRLVVGFDLDGDGNVTGGEPMSIPVDNGFRFKTPSVPGRVVGFPVSLSGTLYPVDTFMVRCW